MIKIDKNDWIVYNKEGILVTIGVHNRDNDRNVNKLKGYERSSILDREFDNAEYTLYWHIYDNKSAITNEQIKENINRKLGLKDRLKIQYETSIFKRRFRSFLAVSGQLFEHSHNVQAIDSIYDIISSHFDKDAISSGFVHQSMGYVFCSREQAKQVLQTFEQIERSENSITK